MILVLLAAVGAATLPTPVRAFVARAEQCRHWGGEEPYDQARAAEIARAVRHLRCGAIERDGAALRARHRRSPAVVTAIDRVLAD